MNIVRKNRNGNAPFGGLLDNFFNSSMSDYIGGEYINNTPSINIIEEKDKFLIEVASPGLDKKDFDVQIENDQLIISASKENNVEKDSESYNRREFNYSSFKRSFYLPETIDSSKINATYKEGILSIALNKKEESIKLEPREIVIK